MKKNKYNILVLSDLKETNNELLQRTIRLTNKVDKSLHFFHVKKPIDVVKRDSQLSTLRTISEQHTLIRKEIVKLVDPVVKTQNFEIDHSYAFGNVKNEIGDYIAKNNPDIIVLGKRKSKPISILGDSITEFVLKNHKGIIMIVNNYQILQTDQTLALGILNSESAFMENEFPQDLFTGANESLVTFSFAEKLDKVDDSKHELQAKSTEYVFEHNDNTIQNLSKYVAKSSINLLLINRNNKKETKQNNVKELEIKSMIDKLNVSLLISGQNN
ncbi:universal stress protein [Bizionia psychrotolerans]|uniref:universal stress protein n=1 Tax=Bizionia psychrotolerans TaxID=1492901 RepID=UPI00065258C1|nr:universal stress protein [Bizionia psychrotolerans]